jgi:hypothetical protein
MPRNRGKQSRDREGAPGRNQMQHAPLRSRLCVARDQFANLGGLPVSCRASVAPMLAPKRPNFALQEGQFLDSKARQEPHPASSALKSTWRQLTRF